LVKAVKAAQANVIRRREEPSATQSLLNTAKVREDSPTTLRLKELVTFGALPSASEPAGNSVQEARTLPA
jgi:hypothetical protein